MTSVPTRSWTAGVAAALRAIALGAIAVAAAPVAAAPVEGSLTLGGRPVAATHVLARLHDNAEGVVRRPLLIVVADRPIPPSALDGIGEPMASRLALAGRLRGILLRIDPARPGEASVIVLDEPAGADKGLAKVTIGTPAQPAVIGLRIGADKVSVTLSRPAGGAQEINVAFALKIAAPLTREPAITADLLGPAIKASPHYKASLAYADAMAQGDVAAQTRLGSRSMNVKMASYPSRDAITERLKEVGVVARTQLAKVHRIVERGDRAALLIDDRAWITMVKENGEWKSGD